jgi:hypothetical protein
MSHRALNRVVVRLLHDATFAARLAVDPDDALAGIGLSAAERGWVTAVPSAAWRTDPARPRRVLSALRDEYAASARLAGAHADRFFASMHFHRAVQERGSLALAFGAHMRDHADARVAALATLEHAMASVRRAPRRPPPSAPDHLRLAPSARVVRLPAGTSALLAALHADRRPPPAGPTDETLLVEREATTREVRIEALEAGLAAVLHRAARPAPRQDLHAVIRDLGGEDAEAAAIIQGLIADRLLI